jgi:ferric-chelate reductase [NAD(P)H]
MISEIDRQVFTQLSYGLYVVTSRIGDRLNGQIVNTVLRVPSEPPRVAVIINKNNLTHEFITSSRLFAASVLDVGTPMTFIGLFGFKSGRDVEKFASTKYVEGMTGCPLVTDHALSVIEARLINQVDVGAHTPFIGDVVAGRLRERGEPMACHYYHAHLGGKSPKAAPMYNPS